MALKTNGTEASRQTPCPLCNHDHYCYLILDDFSQVAKAICQWTESPPDGWFRSGTAKDGRGIFTRDGYREKKRKHYPNFVKLSPAEKGDIPQWDVLHQFGDDKELKIEYHYPSDSGAPLAKVVRVQWSDRRAVYNGKTKQVRPWHHIPPDDWVVGKGDRTWPLYRETEAKEEILKGGYVFVVGGEQAVETYRELGLVATTCAGGEANYKQIVNRLKDSFRIAVQENLTPLLVIHPDNDITGEDKFGERLLNECTWNKIPAVALEPLALWPENPQGGDIFDWVHRKGASWDDKNYIYRSLETEIDEAIERQEIDDKARLQRERWKAPESYQGELGYWRKPQESDDTDGAEFQPKTDFDFQVERELAGSDGGGLLLQIKRTHDKGQRRVFIKSTDYTTAQTFENALKQALGDSVICNLATPEVKALIRVRLHEYHVNRRGRTFRLIDRVGQQEDGVWVFRDRQFTASGESTDESQTRWVWNDMLTGDRESLPKPQLAGERPDGIKNLVAVMARAFGCNFYPSLLVLGYAAAGVHYQQIQREEGAFPILNPYGDPGSGKSSAAECALSLVGMHDDGMLKDVSLSAAYEKLKITGGLTYCLDDPKRDDSLDEFLKGFYNGKARVVRGKEAAFNVQRPHSPMMVTSNHACGEHSAATKSRLISLWFRKAKDGESAAWYELPNVKAKASGCLPQLIKLGYCREEVQAIEQQLVRHLPHAHVRVAKSLALVTWYAEAVCDLAEIPEAKPKLRKYVIQHICPGSNDPDEAGDSLRDFVDKLFVLQSQGKVGDWNMRWLEKRAEDQLDKVLALYLPGIWQVFDKEFKPAYSKKVIEALLREQGIEQTRQRFHRSEDESKAYYRLMITAGCDSDGNKIDIGQPETTVRFCYEIPGNFLRELSDKKQINRSTDDDFSAESQNGEEDPLLISLEKKDQQRSTEINSDPQKVQIPPNPVDPVDPCCFKPINSDLPHPDGDRGQKNGPVDLLIENSAHPPLTEGAISVQSEAKSMGTVPVEQGSMVRVYASATWFAYGSDKLPPESKPYKKKSAASLKVSEIEGDVFHQLMDGGKVIGFSRDGQRVKVRNQQTGRTSVFSLDGVEVINEA